MQRKPRMSARIYSASFWHVKLTILWHATNVFSCMQATAGLHKRAVAAQCRHRPLILPKKPSAGMQMALSQCHRHLTSRWQAVMRLVASAASAACGWAAAHACIALRHLAQLVAVLLVHLLRLAGGLLRARLRVQLLLRADCGVQAGAGRRGRCWWPWRTQTRSCRPTVLRGDEIIHSETREELTELDPCQRGAHGHLRRLPGQREGEGAGVGEQVDRLDVELGQLLHILQK